MCPFGAGREAAGERRTDLVMRIPFAGTFLLVVAVVLMLGGAALMLADIIGAGIAIPLIAVGIALSVAQRRLGRERMLPRRSE